MPLQYTVRLSFDSQTEAEDWFLRARGSGLVGDEGLRHKELPDEVPPGCEVAMIVAGEYSPRAWLIHPDR